MKTRTLLFFTALLAAALPVLAAPTCNAPQVVQGDNCTLLVSLGWVIAGRGTDSVYTVFAPPSASGPVNFQVTALHSNLGSSYAGYLGLKVRDVDGTDIAGPLTLSEILSFGGDTVSPGEQGQVVITEVCWDPTCTSPEPAGSVPNMFSVQVLISTPNTADINQNEVQLVVRFRPNGPVTWQTQETGIRRNPIYTIFPGINLGATPADRYVYTDGALTKPFDVVSITNLNNPGAITGTAFLKNGDGSVVAMAPIPSIPSEGAAGYLVIGRTPGDPLALFPSSLVLPAGPDGVFHGILEIGLFGLAAGGQSTVLAQEFEGYSMLNLFGFGSSVP